MKASAQRRKSRAQIQEEKLQAQQKEAEVAEKMARFHEMEMQVAAAQQNLHQMGSMKTQIDQMFEQGFIFKNPDGTLGLSESEEQRAYMADSASKQPRALDQLNLMAAGSAVRNLEGPFNQVARAEGTEDDNF